MLKINNNTNDDDDDDADKRLYLTTHHINEWNKNYRFLVSTQDCTFHDAGTNQEEIVILIRQ